MKRIILDALALFATLIVFVLITERQERERLILPILILDSMALYFSFSEVKMRRNWNTRKHVVWVLSFGILLIGVPFVIHTLFKLHPSNPFFSAEWTAGDVLLFYGSILAAAGTCAGVFFSIRYSQKNYQEDTLRKVLPLITVTELSKKSNYNPFYDDGDEEVELHENEPLFEEHELKKVFYVFERGHFEAKEKLPEKYKRIVDHNGHLKESVQKGIKISRYESYMYMPLALQNVGNGTAINMRIGLNRVGEKELFVRPVQQNVHDVFYVNIFVPDCDLDEDLQFLLSVVYEDIYGNRYREDFPTKLTNIRLTVSFNVKQKKLVRSEQDGRWIVSPDA